MAARGRAVGLGHRQHAHRRRRHRPGAGADRRAPGLGWRLAPGHRLRDPAARPARPAAGRRDAAHLRLLPRRLPRPDRAVRQAVRAVAALDEPAELNPLAARVREDEAALRARGVAPEAAAPARRLSRLRLEAGRLWRRPAGADRRARLAGRRRSGPRLCRLGRLCLRRRAPRACPSIGLFERRLAAVELVLHNQDNREHDLLDSDDYYQFEGGLAAAVRHLVGRAAGGLPQRPFAPRDARASAR